MQVPPKAQVALQVNEARLALLLQAVRTSLQAQAPSAASFPLAAVDITAQLARCQVSLLLCMHQKSVSLSSSPEKDDFFAHASQAKT